MWNLAACTAALMLGTSIGGFQAPIPNGIPGTDYTVGRIPDGNAMNIAYCEYRPLLGFSTSSVKIPKRGEKTQLTVSDAYKGTFTVGSTITIVSTSSLAAYRAWDVGGKNGTNPGLNYITGFVDSWDPPTRALVLSLNSAYVNGVSSNNAGVYNNAFFGPAGGTGNIANDWQLNFHAPAFWGQNSSYGVTTMFSVPGPVSASGLDVLNWDFSEAKIGMQSGGTLTGNPIRFKNCLFDQAALVPGIGSSCYFNLDASQPWSAENNTIAYNWKKFLVRGTVAKDVAIGDNTIYFDKLPVLPDNFRTQYQDANAPLNTSWRMMSETDITTMNPTRIMTVDYDANAVTFLGAYYGDNPLGIPQTQSAVIKGDTTIPIYTGTGVAVRPLPGALLYYQDNILLGVVTKITGTYSVQIDRPCPVDIGAKVTVTVYMPGNGGSNFRTSTVCPGGSGKRTVYFPVAYTVGGASKKTLYRAAVGDQICYNSVFQGRVASLLSDGSGVILDTDLTADIPAAVNIFVVQQSVTKPIRKGDVIAFFPQPMNAFFGTLVGGGCTLFKRNKADVINDFWSPSPIIGTPTICTQNVVSMIGCDDQLHADVFQYYNWTKAGVEISETVFHWGWQDGFKEYASAFNCHNPRDVTVGQKLAPFSKDIIFRDLVFDSRPEAPCAYMFYSTDTRSYPFKATRANADGKTRVTLGNYADLSKGGAFVKGDYFTIGGSTNAALNGDLPILGGSSKYHIPVPYNTSPDIISPAQGTRLYLPALSSDFTAGTQVYTKAGVLLGFITDHNGNDAANGYYVTLDTPLAADVAGKTDILATQWFDVDVAYTAETSTPAAMTASGGISNSTTLTVTSTAGVAVGMLLRASVTQSNGTVTKFLGDDTFVKRVISSTRLEMTKAPIATTSSSTSVNVGAWTMPDSISLTRMSNIYFRDYLTDGADNTMILNFPSPVQGGVSMEGFYDLGTGAQLNFKIYPYLSATALTQQISYNPKLPAPLGLVVTKVSGGYRLDFAEVSGALGYAYTIDGGTTWSNSYTDASTIVLPGAVVAGSVGSLVGVCALNAINDLGIPVNPGIPSDFQHIGA